MWAGQQDQLGRYLGDLMALVARATSGLLVVHRTADRRYALTAPDGRPVVVARRRADADVFARDRLDLRALVSAVAEVLARHRDGGDWRCAHDGEPVPSTTRQDPGMQLAQRVESA
jgi:hypothetical protein